MFIAAKNSLERYATRYSQSLEKNPLRTKMLTSFSIGCVGDFICQASMRYYHRDDFRELERLNLFEWSPTRSLRQGFVGMVVHAYPVHLWLTKVVPYLVMSPKIVANSTANKLSTLAIRQTLHLATITPYMQASIFFGIATLKGLSIEAGVQAVREKFWSAYQFALVVSPFVLFGLYTFVPPKFGNLYMDLINLVWAVVVSFLANNKANEGKLPSWPLILGSIKRKFM